MVGPRPPPDHDRCAQNTCAETPKLALTLVALTQDTKEDSDIKVCVRACACACVCAWACARVCVGVCIVRAHDLGSVPVLRGAPHAHSTQQQVRRTHRRRTYARAHMRMRAHTRTHTRIRTKPQQVIDFGMAKHVDPHQYHKRFCGTPYYIAPEVRASARARAPIP